jgi:uncharacterized cupredoxin-like copper-binding protein
MMSLKLKTAIAATAMFFASSPALADPGHSAAGKPGEVAKISHTFLLAAKETEDGRMIFEPHEVRVEKGQAVRIVLKNEGEVEHELFLGTAEEIKAHAEEMLKFPEMEHDEPNVVRVDPGHLGEIVWQFTKAGKFEFACLIPGHTELGMVGHVAVVEPAIMGVSAAPRASENR